MKTNLLRYLVLFFIISAFISCSTKELEPPISTSVSENFNDPLGFYDAEPTFSWKLPPNEGIVSQGSYSIVAASSPDKLPDYPDLWKTGRIFSDNTVGIEYEGTPLKSKEKVYWQVKFWDQMGKESEWSETANFELGLLRIADW